MSGGLHAVTASSPEAPAAPDCQPLFRSFFLAGFECSSHKLADGRRLDLLAATRHDELVHQDYARLATVGIRACREGVRWVEVEREPGMLDFSSVLPMLRAAREHGLDVVWDLLHFGWPDDVDVFGPQFPPRFARYARAFAQLLEEEWGATPMLAPINEISFLAWAGGDVGVMNPFLLARGVELKVALVRATLEAQHAVRAVLPRARFLQPEPAIVIHPDPELPRTWRRVECDNELQFQAWDMLTGRCFSWLGGDGRGVDILGVNVYPNNQFTPDGETVGREDPRYIPLSRLLLDLWHRYHRPMVIAETGDEGATRVPWLEYVAQQCREAMRQGCPLHGITLYPVLNHPGWTDGRHIHNGLWDYASPHGERALHAPLADTLRTLAPGLEAARDQVLAQLARGDPAK